jgi:hypothetical protein
MMKKRMMMSGMVMGGMMGVSGMLLVPGCERKGKEEVAKAEAQGAPITNRVDVSPSVRQNLGITFAKVESRKVAQTLRVPGRFELLPTARRQYRAPVAGRVEVLVRQYQMIEAGTPLYRLDSPRWREMQKELADAEASVTLARAGVESIAPLLAAHENHHLEIQKAVDLWTARATMLEKLQAAGGARGEEVAQAKASMAASRSELAEMLEKEAELIARKTETAAQLEAATSRLAFLFQSAASLTGLSPSALQDTAPTDSDKNVGNDPVVRPVMKPVWRTLDAIEVRALASGVVDAVDVTSGGVIDQHAQILSTVQPDQVRFRGVGLQSDLPRLQDGQEARVVPAQGGGSVLQGTLTLAPTADAERRTVDLVVLPKLQEGKGMQPLWAKAGVSAFLEIVTSGEGSEELAIPLRCVARDGTSAIIFRRDPADANKVIRMEADLGLDDGRWVVIKSGVAEGNEIVLDGVYQLMVATSGSITKGGHFHPDGTFHEGED